MIDYNWSISLRIPSALSISEDEKNVYVEASLPGINHEDVEVTFNKGILWEGGLKTRRKEKEVSRRASSSLSYRIAIPVEIDQNKEPHVTGKYGVITVIFAKKSESQPKKIPVKTG